MLTRRTLSPIFATTRRQVRAKSKLRSAVLGDETQNIYSDLIGFYFARPVMGADDNGNALLGPSFYLQANPAAAIMPRPGRKVFYKKNGRGVDVIDSPDLDDLRQAGIDPIALEPNDPYRAFRNLYEIVNLNTYSIGSGLLVNVYPWQYCTADNIVHYFEGTTATTQIDLTTSVPAVVDTHRFSLLVFNITQHLAGMNPLQVYDGTAVSAFTYPNLSINTDLQTCYDLLPTDELIVPIKAYYLAYGQTEVAGIAFNVDVRQFINVPSLLTIPDGFIDTAMIEDGAVTTVKIADGALTLPKVATSWLHNATTAPTLTDDSGDGYAIGTRWINTVTHKEYVCTDATVGAAVWVETTSVGTGTVTSVDIASPTGKITHSGGPITTSGSIDLGIAADAITATEIATGAVGTSELATDAVTQAKMADSSVGTAELIDANVTTAKLADSAVTAVKIAADAVTTVKILNANVTDAKIADMAASKLTGDIAVARLTTALASPPAIGGTAQAAGYFSALRVYIGGFYANIIHAFTGNRTVTIPGDANVTLVGEATTQTLTGKTIDGDDNTLQDIPLTAIKTVGANTKRFITRDASGVISDATSPAFDNAQHNHTNAAGGGLLTGAAFSTQSANLFFAGPSTGAAANPTFRAITALDITSAMATPPAIGGTTPNTGAFTTLTVTTYVSVGANAAGGGAFRLQNGDPVNWRNASNTGDVNGFLLDSSSVFRMGNSCIYAFGGGGTPTMFLGNNNGFVSIGDGTTFPGTAKLFVKGGTDAIQLVVRGHSTQTANLQEWQTSGTTRVASIDNAGVGRFTGLRIDQSPVAATPTPTHTITISVNGTNYRIPCVI